MPVLLPVGDHIASTAICYEVIYPNLIRRFVRDGSELLTTITNDAWYGAILGGVPALGPGVDARDRGGPLSRARGQHRHQRLRRSLRPRHGEDRSCSSRRSSCRTCGFCSDRTIYSRIGDLVAWLSLALTVAALLVRVESSIDVVRIAIAIDNRQHSTIDQSHRHQLQHSAIRIQHRPFLMATTRRTASQVSGSGAPRRRSAELSLTPPAPQQELASIEQRVSDPDFWKDQAAAQKLLQRRRRLEEDRDLSESLRRRADDLAVLVEWAEAGEPVPTISRADSTISSTQVDAGETKKMLGGEHDRKNAIVTIHPGAGGTESQDWAEMLLRMYLRWTERRGFKRDVIDLQPGDEAGIKSATMTIVGDYAYGLMLAEAGVHRLVRISPFDQASRRHTSFASVFVWPELPEDVDVEIEEKDLRIDTYRSSGAGGQHVNVTDSAVRITHLPTGIVVSSQNERSQHRNRDSAMKVLKSRLYDLKLKEQQAKLDQLGGEKKDIAFGSQIRSYVLHPYQLIKDHRTKEEVGDVNRVLDGDIDGFIKTYLMKKASGHARAGGGGRRLRRSDAKR